MQERALKAGVDIIVATPGRLMDHMRQQNADLSGIELLVLDEADRMMDMGFWPDVRRIIAALPAERQTLLFSATMPDEVVRDALEITRDAEVRAGRASAARRPRASRTASSTSAAHDKVEWLIDHLRRPEGPGAGLHAHEDRRRAAGAAAAAAGIKCTALHADRTPGSAAHRRRRIPGRAIQGARRHRHRRARPRHRRAFTRSSTTRCPIRPTPTCTASAAPGAPDEVGPGDHAGRAGRAPRAGGSGKGGRRSIRMRSDVGSVHRSAAQRRDAGRDPAGRTPARRRRSSSSSRAAGGVRRKTDRSAAGIATCCRWPAHRLQSRSVVPGLHLLQAAPHAEEARPDD